jgi:hypothetical protein
MHRSRRNFLAAGLALPAAASASRSSGPSSQATSNPPAAGPGFHYKTLGKTGLKVTTVGMGCMITSEGSMTVECPYGVKVSERLIRAQEMFAC